MRPPAVVVTGIGVLACNGIGKDAFWHSLENGASGIRAIKRFDASQFPCQIAGELWDFHPEDFLRKSEVRMWHRHVHQAVACAKLAREDSELSQSSYAAERVGIAFGTSVGTPDEYYLRYRSTFENNGWADLDKMASSASSGHAATANVSVTIGARGPVTTISSGCSTGLDAIAWGANQIRRGSADAIVLGATEAPLTALTMAVTCALGIVSRRNDEPAKAMRPFDRTSDGLVLSEGAVVLVLERADKARARGARTYAEVAGNGATSEGQSVLVLDKDGKALTRAIEQSLQEAGMAPTDLDGAFCHGVSLPTYDRSEVAAYKRALGSHAYRIPISACKSMIGQAYSAGGLLNVAAALLALHTGTVSPTINLDEPDPVCDLDFVPRKARQNDIRSALVTTMSFGGNHNALVLRKMN